MSTRLTSIEAFRKIVASGLLSKRREEAYVALFNNGPCTAAELWKVLGSKGNQTFKEALCARLSELRELGVAAEVGTKACAVTGQNVILWDVTDQLPTGKVKKKLTKADEQWNEGLRKAWVIMRNIVPCTHGIGGMFDCSEHGFCDLHGKLKEALGKEIRK